MSFSQAFVPMRILNFDSIETVECGAPTFIHLFSALSFSFFDNAFRIATYTQAQSQVADKLRRRTFSEGISVARARAKPNKPFPGVVLMAGNGRGRHELRSELKNTKRTRRETLSHKYTKETEAKCRALLCRN